MRALVKNVRDAELTLLKKLGKATATATKGGGGGGGGQKTTKTPAFDPKKPRALRVYVATRFPEWQDACVQAVQAAWAPETARVDDAKVRALLMERGMIKDKRAMPFVQLFKVRSVAWLWPHFSLLGQARRSMTFIIIETYFRVWSGDGIQAEAAVRGDGCAARGFALFEAHVDSRRCGGLVC
jgi:hypothetical protein